MPHPLLHELSHPLSLSLRTPPLNRPSFCACSTTHCTQPSLLLQLPMYVQSCAHLPYTCLTAQVGRLGDVVALSEAGAAGVFLNPHGYVHDMVTLASAVNVMPMGNSETANSWFPGYAWTLAYCRSCTHHLVSGRTPDHAELLHSTIVAVACWAGLLQKSNELAQGCGMMNSGGSLLMRISLLCSQACTSVLL